MSPATLDALALTGRSRAHVEEVLWPDGKCLLAHPAAAQALLVLREAAAGDGMELGVSSAFRSFEDQARIWTAKWQGKRILLDASSQPIDPVPQDAESLISAILEWSALPGASRHHWGCDFDIFDRAAIPPDYALQLVPEEYGATGPFARLTHWLDANLARFGFFRPYDLERGGVHPEPWHISWAPLSVPALSALTPDCLHAAIVDSDLPGKAEILARLTTIHACQVCRVAVPPSGTDTLFA